jgi:dolichol-phosphate mannosyltransferase
MEASTPLISFIVAALNEQGHIEEAVETILRAVAEVKLKDYEIVLVNDGSTDKTGEIMDRLASHNDRIRVLHNERNLGLGGVYKRGVAAARGEYVMVIAGDNAASAESISVTLAHLGEADIIIPHVHNITEVRSLFRRIGSRGYTILINLLFGLNVRYYNGAVARRALLNTITLTGDGYSIFAELVVKLVSRGHSYVEIGVPFTPTPNTARSSALRFRNVAIVVGSVFRLVRDIHFSRDRRMLRPPPGEEKRVPSETRIGS